MSIEDEFDQKYLTKLNDIFSSFHLSLVVQVDAQLGVVRTILQDTGATVQNVAADTTSTVDNVGQTVQNVAGAVGTALNVPAVGTVGALLNGDIKTIDQATKDILQSLGNDISLLGGAAQNAVPGVAASIPVSSLYPLSAKCC